VSSVSVLADFALPVAAFFRDDHGWEDALALLVED